MVHKIVIVHIKLELPLGFLKLIKGIITSCSTSEVFNLCLSTFSIGTLVVPCGVLPFAQRAFHFAFVAFVCMVAFAAALAAFWFFVHFSLRCPYSWHHQLLENIVLSHSIYQTRSNRTRSTQLYSTQIPYDRSRKNDFLRKTKIPLVIS